MASAYGEKGVVMTAKLVRLHRVVTLPDDYWHKVMATPWHYDLFQLLRRLDAQGGSRYPLGRAPLPKFDPLRIGQMPSMRFAPSALHSVTARPDSDLFEVSLLSFGLFGPNGALPMHLSEYVYERMVHHQDSSFSAFADIFHHRAALLFYRAWADAQPSVSLDRPDDRRFEQYLASLIGMGQPSQLDQGSLSSHARFTYAGHLSRQGKDIDGLQKILTRFFKVPVAITTNLPQWMALSQAEQAQLAQGRRKPRLGISSFLGIAVRDVQHKFRIQLGPLTHSQYQQFFPATSQTKQLLDWVRQYVGIEYEWDLQVVLEKSEVPQMILGGPEQLGYSTWLGKNTQHAPRSDLVYRVEPTHG